MPLWDVISSWKKGGMTEDGFCYESKRLCFHTAAGWNHQKQNSSLLNFIDYRVIMATKKRIVASIILELSEGRRGRSPRPSLGIMQDWNVFWN